MQEVGAFSILQGVAAVIKLLSVEADSSISSDDFFRVFSSNLEAIRQVMEELQRAVAVLSAQRVLELSGSQLMDAGVELYNAPRLALRMLAQVEKSKKHEMVNQRALRSISWL